MEDWNVWTPEYRAGQETVARRYRWTRFDEDVDLESLYEQLASAHEDLDPSDRVVFDGNAWIGLRPSYVMLCACDEDALDDQTVALLEETYPRTCPQYAADRYRRYAPEDSIVSAISTIAPMLEDTEVALDRTGDRPVYTVQGDKITATITPYNSSIYSEPDRELTDDDETLLTAIRQQYPRHSKTDRHGFRQRLSDWWNRNDEEEAEYDRSVQKTES